MDDVSRPEVGEVRGERWAIHRITLEHYRTLSNDAHEDLNFTMCEIQIDVVSRWSRTA